MNILRKINIIDLIPRFISSWLTLILFIPQNMDKTALYLFISLFVIITSLYTYINKKIKKLDTDSIFIFLNYTLCSLKWIKNYNIQNNFQTFLAILIFYIIITIYMINKNKKTLLKLKIKDKTFKILIPIIILIPLIILTTIGILRYLTYNAPNYDFGIFSHIFYYLDKTFIPYSTCERNMLLSHFKVHFSPILYLILPIYKIFKTPITLQVIQVIILYIGIIPIIKLCKHFKFSNKKTLFLIILYSFYPAIACGTFYDFHENCFLLPLLLFTFLFFETEKNIPLFISILLTLLVKEDAAIYLIIFSIYVIVSRKKYKSGTIMLLISTIYFLIVTSLMNKYGLGIMSDRYDNLILDNSGLIGAIKTIIFNPGYVFTQLLTTTNNSFDKIIYLLKIFIPVCFIPIITKKISRYILLIPVFINILTNYIYMYDITFHYSYGIIAFIFYLTIINLNDIKKDNLLFIASISIISTLLLYYSCVIPTYLNNVIDYKNNKTNYKIINEALKSIPNSASVNTTTFFLPHLTNRKNLYEIYYHGNIDDVDYVVIDMRYNDELDSVNEYIKKGYKVILDKSKLITILKKF